jgi:hypothetical protein
VNESAAIFFQGRNFVLSCEKDDAISASLIDSQNIFVAGRMLDFSPNAHVRPND